MITFLIAIGAVALFVVGISITLMVKGHNIEGDVGDNRAMKDLGLKCTIEELGYGESCPSASQECCATCGQKCG